MNDRHHLAAIVLALGCCACGGSGGAAALNAPVPAVTPGAPALLLTGRVVDVEAGNAGIGGATVIIGNAIVSGESPPALLPAGTVRAVTAVDGSFTVSGTPPGNVATDFSSGALAHTGSATLVEVFAGGYVTYHAQYVLASAPNMLTIAMTKPASDDLAWLDALNADRAAAGAPPVALDAPLLQAARAWAAHEVAVGIFGFSDPALPPGAADASLQNAYTSRHGFTVAGGENLTVGPSDGPAAEAAFRTEAVTGGPHWLHIVDQRLRWAGFGSALCVPGRPLCPVAIRTWVQYLSVAPS